MHCQGGWRWQKEMKQAKKNVFWSLENIKLCECDLCVCACMHTCEKLLHDVISVVYKVFCYSEHLLAKRHCWTTGLSKS